MPPPIRYPLPTLVLLLAVGLVSWYGRDAVGRLRATVAERLQRALVTPPPPIPASTRPQVVTGPIVRKALLLHDDVAVSALPGGPTSETIRVRMVVEVYDVWPIQGTPTHFRVGNSRRPFGWVRAGDLFPWDTRLVVRAPEGVLPLSESAGEPGHPRPVGLAALPVLEWSPGAVKIAVWEQDAPWERVAFEGWVALDNLPPTCWGVWISREELLALLRRSLDRRAPREPNLLRLRAVLGRLADDRPISEDEAVLARSALPPFLSNRASSSSGDSSDRLARANEQWRAEADWAGVSFEMLPLSALP